MYIYIYIYIFFTVHISHSRTHEPTPSSQCDMTHPFVYLITNSTHGRIESFFTVHTLARLNVLGPLFVTRLIR